MTKCGDALNFRNGITVVTAQISSRTVGSRAHCNFIFSSTSVLVRGEFETLYMPTENLFEILLTAHHFGKDKCAYT